MALLTREKLKYVSDAETPFKRTCYILNSIVQLRTMFILTNLL